MYSIILAWILSLQMLLSMLVSPTDIRPTEPLKRPCHPVQETRLFWGLIDPELSLWFSRMPRSNPEADTPFHWDFSWRGFLSALFAQPIIKEDAAHAPHV